MPAPASLSAVAGASQIWSSNRSWGDYALASVIHNPQPSIADSDPVGTMAAARSGWPTPEDLRERIERWLPHAAGQRHTADDLIGLLQVAPLATQATLGLPWLRTVILTEGRWSNRGTWRAVDWLKSLRDGSVLDERTRPVYNELVNALAADGYHSAVDLQHEDE